MWIWLPARPERYTRGPCLTPVRQGPPPLPTVRPACTPVVALSQFNRGAVGRRPLLSDFKESRAIEQDSNVVLLLHEERDADHDALTALAYAYGRQTADTLAAAPVLNQPPARRRPRPRHPPRDRRSAHPASHLTRGVHSHSAPRRPRTAPGRRSRRTQEGPPRRTRPHSARREPGPVVLGNDVDAASAAHPGTTSTLVAPAARHRSPRSPCRRRRPAVPHR
ncbi:DnaB-like helicase C-terminal domain-containing protein [Streptomyces sp. NPDC090131]|uniref:DnaB-like helicase C-terminal domain-containing protein n=1 Tax=Streptomyces sp. NPDC090131 TaxID=3365954 RepID=UPI0037FBEA56